MACSRCSLVKLQAFFFSSSLTGQLGSSRNGKTVSLPCHKPYNFCEMLAETQFSVFGFYFPLDSLRFPETGSQEQLVSRGGMKRSTLVSRPSKNNEPLAFPTSSYPRNSTASPSTRSQYCTSGEDGEELSSRDTVHSSSTGATDSQGCQSRTTSTRLQTFQSINAQSRTLVTAC
jgi:hypothetical protein